MPIQLYELCGRDPDLRFSPFAWRSRMALAHKGLDFDSVPWRFTEKDAIAFSGQGKVPVLKDGETIVADSWEIALYLEHTYPDRPPLFGGPAGEAGVTFVRHWCDTLLPLAAPLAFHAVWALLDETDQAYFRETREARVGKRLEDVCGDPEARVAALAKGLAPARAMLADSPYLGGSEPLYSDHLLFGILQWVRCVNPIQLLAADDPVQVWFERMLDAYGGHARAAKTCRDLAA
jgi:glutathione S-transferase